MPGPSQLVDLMAYLRLPDRRARLAALAHQLVPGRIADPDTIAALVWVTGDMARTVESVVAPFVPAERDGILGGDVLLVRLGRLVLLVEQPHPEGPAAAFLSRHGDGVGALYLAPNGSVPPPGPSGSPPRPAPSPLGLPAWLMPHDWPWGPFIVLLARGSL
jgi:hypothetical protein